MNDFDWTSFTRKIAVKASIKDMYDAWTQPQQLEYWFLSKAHYTRPDGSIVGPQEHVQPEDKYQWSWHTWDILEEGKVLLANGKDHIRFSFAGDCTVDIRLEQVGDVVMVELVQSNIPTDDKSKKDIRLGCYEGWTFYMVNMKSLYEGGVDLRNMDPALKEKGVLNT